MTEQVPAYQVEGMQDVMVRNEQGMLVPGKRINVRQANGNMFFVEVPYAAGWSDAAQEQIEAQHAEHQSMAEHQGPMVPAPRPSTPLRARLGQ